MAADANRADCVTTLLDSGADINKTSLGGLTPLHIACRNGSLGAVIALLAHPSADIDAESIDRATPEMVTEDPLIKEAIVQFRNNK